MKQPKKRDWNEDPAEWTLDKEGRSNSSAEYEFLVGAIASLIRGDAHSLLNGQTERTARLIVSHLAHKYGLIPTMTAAEMEEEARR